jgi:hypothetical protein
MGSRKKVECLGRFQNHAKSIAKDQTMASKKKQPTRIDSWSEYQKAVGYDVEVRVTYTRIRKVRANSEEQAIEFAVQREKESAKNSYQKKVQIGFNVEDVTSGKVALASERTKGKDNG